MSFLLAVGGASMALALQATGNVDDIQTDANATVDTCIAQIPAGKVELSRKEMQAYLGCIFQDTAMQMNAQLPLKVDDQTTLVAVSASGAQFNYTYIVNLGTSGPTGDTAASFERGTRKNVCADADMVATMKEGGSFFYRWLEPSGKPIHTALIDSC